MSVFSLFCRLDILNCGLDPIETLYGHRGLDFASYFSSYVLLAGCGWSWMGRWLQKLERDMPPTLHSPSLHVQERLAAGKTLVVGNCMKESVSYDRSLLKFSVVPVDWLSSHNFCSECGKLLLQPVHFMIKLVHASYKRYLRGIPVSLSRFWRAHSKRLIAPNWSHTFVAFHAGEWVRRRWERTGRVEKRKAIMIPYDMIRNCLYMLHLKKKWLHNNIILPSPAWQALPGGQLQTCLFINRLYVHSPVRHGGSLSQSDG